MNPDEIADRLEITELLAKYAWAIDGKRTDLFTAVFTPDIDADYGPFGSFTDLDTLARRFDEYHAQFATTQHIITNACIEVEGASATCRSYFQATMVFVHDPSEQVEMLTEGHSFRGGGYYEDLLVRTPQGWRISERKCVGAWFKPAPELIYPSAEGLTAD